VSLNGFLQTTYSYSIAEPHELETVLSNGYGLNLVRQNNSLPTWRRPIPSSVTEAKLGVSQHLARIQKHCKA
jgi:hypothetical protein